MGDDGGGSGGGGGGGQQGGDSGNNQHNNASVGGGGGIGPAAHAGKGGNAQANVNQHSENVDTNGKPRPSIMSDADITSPMSPRIGTPNPWSRKNTSLDLDDYFSGPRDLNKHSKWPIFLQMHGSILPKMLLPLLVVGGWATCITCISELTKAKLGISNILLTVTGFVVGLGLSFRSSTAYERYAEGRRYWTQLIFATQALGRVFWIHAKERTDDPKTKKEDMLAKMTAMNLLVAFAVSLKHKLRFEPYTEYEDLAGLVGHLDTFALAATREDHARTQRTKPGFFKSTGSYLGVSFAASNPRKAIKRATRPLGNLPLEILTYLASFTDELVTSGQLGIGMQQTLAYNNIAVLNDVLTGTERVLTTPLPIAYAIAINQITWVYVMLLPFQLLTTLHWITIPATVFASYIILGILFIGREIEDPFGQDVNDLPLESYCAQIAAELDIIASRPTPTAAQWVKHPNNKVLFPLSSSGYHAWLNRSEDKIAAALKAKPEMGYEERRGKREASAETETGDQNV